MNLEEWKSQIKRGTLEYCVMLLVSKRDYYGYELMTELSAFPIVAAKESTTYPLLRRLEKDSYLTSYWQETTEGLPPRKYYSITERGERYLSAMSTEWSHLVKAVQYIKGDKNG